MADTCAVCGRPKWHKDMETDPNESCDYATQSSWMESDPEGAKCYRLGYERQKDRADSCFVAMTLASDRATEAEEALAAARRECEGLRKLLWLRHGCPIAGLYGDDGEMQCGSATCLIDFKRMAPETIEERWTLAARAALAGQDSK